MNSAKHIPATRRNGTRHSEWQLLLMIVPILIIAGFQGYWLMDNYRKEEKNLQLRADISFKETVRNLQAKKLKIDKFFNEPDGNFNLEMSEANMIHGRPPMEVDEFAGLLNDVTIRVNDSLIKHGDKEWVEKIETSDGLPKDTITHFDAGKRNMVISFSKPGEKYRNDSPGNLRIARKSPSGEIIRLLYRVDSMQEPLRISEIDSAYKSALHKQGIDVGFSILQSDSAAKGHMGPPEIPRMNKITIGFSHPVTYELKLGNSFGYLLKKIISPILFSLFLVGVTILSFILLYRNLIKQRRLTEIKNEFISNITHELKTPIATVGVAIEALRNFNAINDPQRTKEYLDISQNELQRLSLLVDKVLKLSMFEKKEIELKYEPLDLKDVVNEVVSSMRLQIEKHHATVSVNQEGDTNMQADKLHLLSVVYNLLDNALKYGNGNIAVKIEIKETGDNVELTVADNGIGISPEYKDKVFEKFFRIPAGNTHNTKGYGLGLSYVAHVIQKHKGKIEIESQPGIGTKFIISLPKNT
jgi:two-component system phosphate regulon sensor histidine kinase PhoR